MAKAKVPGSGDVARRLDKVEVAIIRLAKAQERTEERLTLLAESTERSIQHVTESVLLLAKGQERLIEAQRLTSEELIQLGKRMDSYGEQVLRGFTESARRNGDVNAKVEALEKRIEALERAQ